MDEKQVNKKRLRLRVLLPIAGALVLTALLLLVTGVVAGPSPPAEAPRDEAAVAGIVPPYIFYQGRLFDPGTGDPVMDGSYAMTFSLYTQFSGGTAVDQDSRSVSVSNGLFRTYIGFTATHYNGQALWVGVQVEDDPEMVPRHYLRPVPYALGLRPGAVISGEVAYAQPALKVVNTGGGNAIRGYKDGTGAAIAGVNDGSGMGGYFSSAGDYALYVDGDLFVNGSVWAKSYANVVVVAKGRGGDYTSVQSALDSITDATEDNPYLVRVMPGIYEEQVTLKSHVAVQGSGWRLTVISSSNASLATVTGADNTVLSSLRVVNSHPSGGDGSAISNWDVEDMSIEGVAAQISGNFDFAYGIYNSNSSVEIRNSIIFAGDGEAKFYGVFASGSTVDVSDSFISASGDPYADTYGVYASSSTVDIGDSLISASGGSYAYAVRSADSEVNLQGCILKASAAPYSYAAYNTDASGMSIQQSTLQASSSVTGAEVYGIYNYTNRTVLSATNTTVEVDGAGVTNVDGVQNRSHATAMLDNCTIRATGDSATQWVIGARNTETSTLTLRRSVIHADGNLAYTDGIYNIAWATTNIWFSEIYADATDGVVKGIHSYRGAPFNVYYSTISATGGGAGVGEDAYSLYTDRGNQSISTEILIRGGMLSGEDYAIGNAGDDTSYTIRVIETWLEGAVDDTGGVTYVCLGAHDGTNYLSAVCQP